MRLTLRHLLAYMDGNLRPEDAESFGKRIEESKVATDLYHKIRDVMKRIRLAAPSVNERSSIFDCNSVAEYLDNAMPGDRVVEFEHGCLKSDMHLAEVASSHQILTVVQVEPAEIDPESRQRMYQLPKIAQQADEERTAAAEAASLISGDGAALAGNAKSRPRPVVPEYLREPSRKPRFLFVVAGVFLASAAIGLLLMAFGQFDGNMPLGRALAWAQTKMGGHPPEADKTADKSSATNTSSAGTTASPAASNAATSSSAALALSASDGKTAAGQPPALMAPANASPTAAAPGGTPAGEAASVKSVVSEPPMLDKTLGSDKKPGGEPIGSPAAPLPPAMPKGPEVAIADGGKMRPPEANANVPEPPAGEPAVDAGPRVGKFISDGQDVLLKLEAAQTWRRVLPEEFLPAGQSLIALPCYRPRVVLLNVAATLEMLSGTKMDLAAPGAQGIPGANIDYGRVVVKPLAQAGAGVRVSLGGHTGTLTLANVDSVAGFEMVRIHAPGTDPEKVLAPPRSTLYVAKGSVIWDEGSGKQPARLSAPVVWQLDDPSAQAGDDRQSRSLPDWVMNNTTSDRDQRAALDVSQSLPTDRPASLVLTELSDNRRMEIRWLAVRCLSHLGRFEPMVTALNDKSFRSEWPDYIDQLRDAITRGPETASAIHAALNTKFGNDAPELFRMLWGYNDKDLSNGDDARLVKYLDSEAIIFRVLAINALREITTANFSYRAEQPSGQRAAAVMRWKQQLAAGKIRSKAVTEKNGEKIGDKSGDKLVDKSKAAPVPEPPPTAPVPLPEDNVPGNVPDIGVPDIKAPSGTNGKLPPPPKPANPAPEDETPGSSDTNPPPGNPQPK